MTIFHPRRLFLLLLSFFVVTQVTALADTEINSVPQLEPDKRLVYKLIEEGADLEFNLFLPKGHKEGDKRPVIVFFFGGGWLTGTPEQFFKQSDYFASRGMVAISAQYRTKSSHETLPPACVQDGKSAIRYIREHAEKLGIDPSKVCAAGGSAGGHVAASTATLTGYDEPGESLKESCVPNALILFNPVYDTSEKGYGFDRVKDYWRGFSPKHNLSESTPPTIVFFGDQDRYITPETAKEFQNEMLSHGVRSELHIFPGEKHGFFNVQKYDETLQLADEFLVSLKFLEPKVDSE